jgi:tungstate transport system permease protein
MALESLGVLLQGFIQALRLIASGDPAVLEVTIRSVHVSALSTTLATIWSLPIALVIGLKNFPGKKIVKSIFQGLLGIPTVTLGLFFYLLLSRSGPLGIFHLLYTINGMSLGQSVLITPIIVSFTASAIEATDIELRDLARTLGARETRVALTVARESISGITLSIVAAFNRAFAELGVVMMLGGNIYHITRVLTTSIALQTAMGEIAFSIALSIILLTIVISITFIINVLRRTR